MAEAGTATGVATATEAMDTEAAGAVTVGGVAADMEVAAWVATAGAVRAPAGRVEPLLCARRLFPAAQ
jgi:hypothetical protein